MTSYVPRMRTSNHSLHSNGKGDDHNGGVSYIEGNTVDLDELDVVPNMKSNGTNFTLVEEAEYLSDDQTLDRYSQQVLEEEEGKPIFE